MTSRRSRANPFAASNVSRPASAETLHQADVPADILDTGLVELRGGFPTNTRTGARAIPEDIADLLASRYEHANTPYSRIGDRIVVAIDNDQIHDPQLVKDASKRYADVFRSSIAPHIFAAADRSTADVASNNEPLPAHVFDLAQRAYHHMVSAHDDQCILLLGDAGSGKSSNSRAILRHLADISRVGERKSKYEAQILKVPSILSSFGGAMTPHSHNASCFTAYSEVQFDDEGCMVGMKVIDYLFDTARVSASSMESGRNLDIFYQLFAGATPEEKLQLSLTDVAHFHYLHPTEHQSSDKAAGLLVAAAASASTPSIADSFTELRDSLKAVGVGRRLQSHMWQLLAAILHLGNIVFAESTSDDTCSVHNYGQLELVSNLLGVHPDHLRDALVYRQQRIGKDLTSIILTPQGAARQRDALARTLYGVFFSWLLERINDNLCLDEHSWSNYIAVLDTPGFFGRNFPDNSLHRLLTNYQQERLLLLLNDQMFQLPSVVFENEAIPFDKALLDSSYREVVDLMSGPKNGVITIVDRESARGTRDSKISQKISDFCGTNKYFISSDDENLQRKIDEKAQKYAFGIKHTPGTVLYSSKGFSEADTDILQSDFVTLIRGSPELPGTTNVFIRNIFSDSVIATKFAQSDGATLVAAKSLSRRPSSVRRRKTNETIGRKNSTAGDNTGFQDTVGNQFISAFGDLISVLNETQTWFALCLRPTAILQNARVSATKRMRMVDRYLLTHQVGYFGLLRLMCTRATMFTSAYFHKDFIKSVIVYADGTINTNVTSETEALNLIKNFVNSRGYRQGVDILVGVSRIFVSERVWRELDALRGVNRRNGRENAAGLLDGTMTADETTMHSRENSVSATEVESHMENQFTMALKSLDNTNLTKPEFGVSDLVKENPTLYASGTAENSMVDLLKASEGEDSKDSGTRRGFFGRKKKAPVVKEAVEKPPKKPLSSKRLRWLIIVWLVTWWVPGFMLGWCGMPKDSGRRIAWREKVTLCVMILLMNASVLFVIIGIGLIICPQRNQKSPGEISSHYHANSHALVYMYGNYYDVSGLWTTHGNSGYADDSTGFWESEVLGQDVSQMFNKENAWSTYCPGFSKPAVFSLFPDEIMNSDMISGTWYSHNISDLTSLKKHIKGDMVWDHSTLSEFSKNDRYFLRMYDRIYDVTSFLSGTYSQTDDNFLGSVMAEVMSEYADSTSVGSDATSVMNRYRAADETEWASVMTCMQGLFLVGRVDHRGDAKCVATNYILLAASIIVFIVIGVKFLAALQFGSKKQPEEYEKFVVLQVPCYTEDENSLRRTIDSLALLEYEDSHKLLLIICDGMIVGSGNEKPTPRLVLDILGVADDIEEPDKVAFQSVGDNNLQLNFARVYSGLYELQGRTVPYMVVVKVGKDSERHRPGNRGKRDSQLILMRFLNKVFYKLPMNPLECEMYHQIKNVIGVDPSYYEFVLMVDADTNVLPDALNRLVSTMVRDAKIAGLCGETLVANEHESFVTMIQVYEYFISHHMAKAFESLFGTVTCLPGCFCMYRIRGVVNGKNAPILVNKNLLKDYSENTVDTLHLKNLLHLGEDRYLTTLILKHFPYMKTCFTSDSKAKTNAPNKWNVLFSQRRRWINSTVHNLFELLHLEELCGFLCFSMRFVVFVDITATFVQPATLGYILYLIIHASTSSMVIPTISIILIAAIYGLQIVIFVLRRQWQHIGWMFFYLLAIGLFGCAIPAYSFWHFDDFSWGTTRKLEGQTATSKKKAIVEKFDESSIPLMEYSEFEPLRLQKEHEYQLRVAEAKREQFLRANEQIAAPVDPRYVTPSVGGGSFAGGLMYDPIFGGAVHVPPSNASLVGPDFVDDRIHDFVAQQRAMHIPQEMQQGQQQQQQQQQFVAEQERSSQQPTPQQRSRTGSVINVSAVQGLTHEGAGASPVIVDGPSDEEILIRIREILATADLMKVTKKSVREQLSVEYGVDMMPRKDWINTCIDAILKSDI